MPTATVHAVTDWLHVHRLLVERENAFTVIAMRAAAGEVSLQELDGECQVLLGLRALWAAVYDKAFPDAADLRLSGAA
jgi:hypothetical protein